MPLTQPSDRIRRLLDRRAAAVPPEPVHREAFAGAYGAAGRQPHAVRLAAGVANTFRMMPAAIQPDELIVGGRHLRQIVGFRAAEGLYCDHELAVRAAAEQPDLAPQIQRILAAWQGHTTAERIAADRTATERLALEVGVIRPSLAGRAPLDLDQVLRVGLNGIQAECVSRRNRASAEKGDDEEALAPYDALLLVADGVIEFAHNHSLAARQLADQEDDARRKAELRQLAAICRRAPARPAATFHEALQAAWFLVVLDGDGLLDRPDGTLWPYLRRDLDAGEVTPQHAQELVDCLWLKLGDLASCTVRLGADDGEAKRLTRLFLAAAERLDVPSPRVASVSEQAPSAIAEVDLRTCLDLALSNGAGRQVGRQIGPRTGDPRLVPSYQHLLAACKAQAAHFAAMARDLAARECRIRGEHAPNLLRLLLSLEATESPAVHLVPTGAREAAQRLLAIRHLVFEQWQTTMAEVVTALAADFVGYERLREALQEPELPGAEVDTLASELVNHCAVAGT
jgi:hypothetical protein